MNTPLLTPGRRLWIKLGLLAVALAAGTVVADHALAPIRLDFTQNRRHTLSLACHRMLAGLKEPVTLTLYASQSAARGVPQLQTHVKRVHELLAQMGRASGGKIKVRELDPEPYSDAEQKAGEAGLEPVQLAGSRSFYLGLVGTNATDGREILPFLSPAQGDFLESDLARLVAKLDRAKKPKVGLLTDLPVNGGPMSPPWAVASDLRDFFDLVPVAPSARELPKDLDLLLALHPRNCDADLLKQVDAFAHGGKPVILALDPFNFTERAASRQQRGPMMAPPPGPSDFGALTRAWGIAFDPAQVAADRQHAMRQGAAGGRGTQDLLPVLDLPPGTFDRTSPFFANLNRLRLVMPGVLAKAGGAATHFQPLVSLGAGSGTLPASAMEMPDPAAWKRAFAPDDQTRVLAALVTGPAPLAYPETPKAETPKEAPKDAAAKDAGKPEAAAGKPPENPPTGNLRVLAIADADFLHEMWWATPVQMGGRTVGYEKQADNAEFLLSAMDLLASGGDLAHIHARGGYDRPFTFVDGLRKEAEAREMGQLAALEEKRRDTWRKISDLRGGAAGKNGEITLSAEQKKELENSLRDYAQSGDELRRRRYELNKDVERLGTLVTVLNASVAPLLVAAAALALAAWRHKNRKEARA